MATGTPTLGNVAVRIDDLIVGRSSQYPFYDESGMLLLAAGLNITPEIKRQLHTRGKAVWVNEADANQLTASNQFSACQNFPIFETDMTRKLDEIIRHGIGPVLNRGLPVREATAARGRVGYDPTQRQELQARYEQNSECVANMMSLALRGEAVDGAAIATMVGECVNDLVRDTDNALTSVDMKSAVTGLGTNPLAVSLLCMAIGVEIGLDVDNVRDLGVCGLVHDWGMLRVPTHIREATHRLDPGEWVEITKHPIYTLEMLEKASGLPRQVPLVVYQVHEKPNGDGYPRGRTSNNIHPFAKVVQVADVYMAIRSPRAYRAPLMPYAAMESLIRQARDRAVDSETVRALLRTQSLFPLGSFVALSDGSLARVLRPNGEAYTKPIVQRLQDAAGTVLDPLDDANLLDLKNAAVTIRQALPTPGTNEVALFDSAA